MFKNLFKSRHSFLSVLAAVILCCTLICDCLFFAQAAGTSYTIHYDANPESINKSEADVFSLSGNDLPMPDSQHLTGEWKQLNKNDYGIKGYKFVGWSSRPDGKGTIEDISAEVTVNFFVENSANDVELVSSAVYKVGETIEVPTDPLHWSVDGSTKEDNEHFTYTFEKWENITDKSGADIECTSGSVVASASVNYLAKFQKDTVSWFIKGDSSTLKNSTGIAVNDMWVQARYNEALANNNVPTGQLVLYPTNAGLQSAKGLNLIGTLDIQPGVGSAPWYSKASSIKSVYVRPGVRANASVQGLFADLTLATAIDVKNLNTALATNFNSMFLNAESATTINVTGLNTSSGTDFANMFDDCYVVTKISGIESFDMSKATTVELMFSECKKLASLDLSKWDTNKVKNFRGTFSGMHSLKFNSSMGNLNTSSATNMSIMFQYCLQFVDIAFGSRFVTSNVTDMSGMFNYCENLVEIDMSYFNTRKVKNFNKVAANNTTPMFDSCMKLSIVHVGQNFGFSGDGSTTVAGGLKGYLPNPQDCHYDEINSTSTGKWFAESDGDAFAYNAIPNYVSGGETYRIYKSYAALYGTKTDGLTFVLGRTASDTAPATYNGLSRYLTVWNIETAAFSSANDAGWKDYRSYVKSVVVAHEIKPKNMGYWFYNFNNCTSYNLSKLNTSKCVAFNHVFYANDSITTLNVLKFNTSAATQFQGMFYNCGKIKELSLSSFDMSKASNTNNMFAGMNKLQEVHLGAKWKWVGTGGYLPNQNGKISGADGKWYTAGGVSYAPANIPSGAGSYYAISTLAPAASTASLLSINDDGTSATRSSNNVLQLDVNTELDNVADSVVTTVTPVTYNVSATGIDGSLVDPNEILFFRDEESVTNLTDKSGAVITLYAIWQPIEFTITYDGNGKTGGDTPDSLHEYDKPQNLTKNGFYKTGYEFVGWNTKPDNSGTFYSDESYINNLSSVDGDVIILYAQWQKISGSGSDLMGFIRFINKNYLNTLLPNSKWRTGLLNDELVEVLNNDLADVSSCCQVWHFSAEDFKGVQEWSKSRKKGAQTNQDFFAEYYDKHCIVDNSDK